ncbi:tRNA1(Val) A37 N6-methylase TrmN6 [Hyphomicrobiales bacterium]|nr:tRNA1(Val) A37 N6-methylase TrmN6 [Hyphomicrobiales bacterium]CAH1700930.1 tRNA1(Val) A37 N6-methylase TrmN6 [Hyphomicrobiales bacterium]CAI0344805.1 tRNA1Val (adenine37-N6)-methyltransferase [Hyphomicrobiales bacterium]
MNEAEASLALGEIVEDQLLDGRLLLRQPRKGHRAGTDAILLAAALPALAGGTLLDIGAGVGTVGLSAALLRPTLRAALLERDPELAALARRNAELNGLAGRITTITADVTAPAAELTAAGLGEAAFDAVAMNPPFYPPGGTRASPTPNRKAAHVAEGDLGPWLRAARRVLRPGGLIAIIHRAEALPDLLAGLSTGFGALTIRPVHGVADRPAIRVIVTAVLNSRKPAALLPAFVINGSGGGFTAESEAVHRGRASLAAYQ